VSASEKLKALIDAKVWEDDDMNDVAFIDALPHIVAVVEAAEFAVNAPTDIFNEWERFEPAERALAALEEALS